MNHSISKRRTPKIRATALLLLASVLGIWGLGAMTSSVAAASDSAKSTSGATEAAAVATWQRQSPLPTGATLYSVDMTSALEGWAVGEDDPLHIVQGITNGTILHTTDGGTTWVRQNSGINEPLNAVDFLDSTHGWAVGNNDSLYTTNGGQTWNAGTGLVGSFYNVEFATPLNGFTTGNGTGYYHTTDGGHTWQLVQMGGATIGRIQFFDANNGIANSPDGVYHTSNGGNTWSLTGGHGGSSFSILTSDGTCRTTYRREPPTAAPHGKPVRCPQVPGYIPQYSRVPRTVGQQAATISCCIQPMAA